MLHLPYRELPAAEPGTPDTRSPVRYLIWIARQQRSLLTFNAIFGIGWMVSQALIWAAVGCRHRSRRHPQNTGELFIWVGVVVALGLFQALCGALRHQLAVTNWMNASYRTVQVIGHHVARTGTALTDEIPSGDVVNTVASDAMRIGGAYDVFARFLGAIAAWIVVSFILLSTSVELGLIVLIGVPVLASLTTPLMKPLHATQAAQREAAGRLAALGSDTVAGLRILRGVGGEDVFLDNYKRQSDVVRLAGNRIASPQAGLESGQVLLPAVLTGRRHLPRRPGRHARLPATRPTRRVLRLRHVPHHAASHGDRVRDRHDAGLRRGGAGLRILNIDRLVTEPESRSAGRPRRSHSTTDVSGVSLRRGQLVAFVTETPEPRRRCSPIDWVASCPTSTGVTINGTPLDLFSVADTRAQHRRERDRTAALLR